MSQTMAKTKKVPMWASALGQAMPPVPPPTGVPQLDCYVCGNIGPRWMTAGMASQNPQGCQRVEDARCPGPRPGPPGGQPPPRPPTPCPVPAGYEPLPGGGARNEALACPRPDGLWDVRNYVTGAALLTAVDRACLFKFGSITAAQPGDHRCGGAPPPPPPGGPCPTIHPNFQGRPLVACVQSPGSGIAGRYTVVDPSLGIAVLFNVTGECVRALRNVTVVNQNDPRCGGAVVQGPAPGPVPAPPPPGPAPVPGPGRATRSPGPGCVRLVQQRSRMQIVSTITEPWQVRGWRIVRLPTGEVTFRGTRSEFNVVDLWACPPPGVMAPPPDTTLPLQPPPLVPPPPPPPPSETVPPDQAARMLDMVTGVRAALDDAVARAMSAGATDADRAAAAAVAACLDGLVAAAGPLDALTAALEVAVRAGAGARVGAGQAAALQAFVDCAQRAEAARAEAGRGGALEAIVGVGLPAAAALLVAL